MRTLQADKEICKIKMMDTLAKQVNEQGEIALTKRKLQELYDSTVEQEKNKKNKFEFESTNNDSESSDE
jgi:hypothetical protein